MRETNSRRTLPLANYCGGVSSVHADRLGRGRSPIRALHLRGRVTPVPDRRIAILRTPPFGPSTDPTGERSRKPASEYAFRQITVRPLS